MIKRSAFVITVGFLMGSLLIVPAWGEPKNPPKIDKQAIKDLAEEKRRSSRAEYDRAVKKAEAMGLPIRRVTPGGKVIALYGLNENGVPIYVQSLNLGAAETISTDHVWPSGEPGGSKVGFDLSGSGDEMGIWEVGGVPDTSHVEFGNRLSLGESDIVRSHATHVAGGMIAEGIDPEAHGMAFEGSLIGYNSTSDVSEMLAEGAGGMLISNHSYGLLAGWTLDSSSPCATDWVWWGHSGVSLFEDYLFGFYTSRAQEYDDVADRLPQYLIVAAASNDNIEGPSLFDQSASDGHLFVDRADGTASCETTSREDPDGGTNGFDSLPGGLQTAKNTLVVGAVEEIPGGYTSSSDVKVTDFSSFGPTDDGRIKPELVSKGIGVYSTRPGDAYDTGGGTSFAAPNVAGSVDLLQEHWQSLFGPGAYFPTPRSSTMRALLIHTADEAGGHPSPDNKFGWGLMNTRKAAAHLTADTNAKARLVGSHQVGETEAFLLGYSVENTNQPLKVTLSWTDPPGDVPPVSLDPSDTVLVNNLDLRVIGPGGSVNRPWVPPSTSNPGRTDLATGDNDRSVNEQVRVANPQAGNHWVKITFSNDIAGDSTQWASVVTSQNVMPLQQDDCGAGKDADTPPLTSIEAPSCFNGERGTGHLDRWSDSSAFDPADAYSISMDQGDTVFAEMRQHRPACPAFGLGLVDSTGTIADTAAGNQGFCDTLSVNDTASDTGSYVLVVHDGSESTFTSDTYALTISTTGGSQTGSGGGGGGGGGSCLIERTAPASWTSSLRALRDEALDSAWGRHLAMFYYRWMGGSSSTVNG